MTATSPGREDPFEPRESSETASFDVGVQFNAAVQFNADGLVCAVVQQYDTLEVLMVAWMDEAALRATLSTGRATYFSRSRQRQWVKGETSGHTQRVVEVRHDCDADTLLVLVDQVGPACHTGTRSCFDGRRLTLG
jgi:phosphoribosyl-AMP cyclohydrolase